MVHLTRKACSRLVGYSRLVGCSIVVFCMKKILDLDVLFPNLETLYLQHASIFHRRTQMDVAVLRTINTFKRSPTLCLIDRMYSGLQLSEDDARKLLRDRYRRAGPFETRWLFAHMTFPLDLPRTSSPHTSSRAATSHEWRHVHVVIRSCKRY